MRQKKQGEGTKIAQAAKELNVTSVTIRRYITEFNIETTADENGIKVLPPHAMEELYEIRRLKEEGLTNPKVMEHLEERRSKPVPEPKAKATKEKPAEPAAATPPVRRATRKTEAPPAAKVTRKPVVEPAEEEEQEVIAPPVVEHKEKAPAIPPRVITPEPSSDMDEEHDEEDNGGGGPPGADGKSKYSLTCQTCNKVFEHMNPRLRDCLDCYRIKRKERRRGGDKKNVIQNPIAQQVVSKNQQAAAAQAAAAASTAATTTAVEPSTAPSTPSAVPLRSSSIREALNFAPPGTLAYQRPQVRNYRKAIEETRQITSNLKRRLERPDLPEAERRFLEQIYAYQLILHQGWRHLAEYKSGGTDRGGD